MGMNLHRQPLALTALVTLLGIVGLGLFLSSGARAEDGEASDFSAQFRQTFQSLGLNGAGDDSVMVNQTSESVQAVSDGPDFPRLGIYGFVGSTGVPLVSLATDQLDPVVMASYAKRDLVIMNVTPLTDRRPDIIPGLRALNPNIKIMAYVHSSAVWCGPPGYEAGLFYRKTWEIVESFDTDGTPYSLCQGTGNGFLWLQNGLMADESGMNVNLAHKTAGVYDLAEDYADLVYNDVYLKQRVNPSQGLWDGVFFDVFCSDPAFIDVGLSSHFDYVRAGYPDAAAFYAGWKGGYDALTTRLRSLIGDNEWPILGNCGQGQPSQWPNTNGWMREGFPSQNGGTWLTNMYREVGGYLFEENNFRSPRYNTILAFANPSSQPFSATNRRQARYALASASLGTGYGMIGDPAGSTVYDFYNWWYDEYGVNNSGASSTAAADTGWLGQPLAEYYQYFGANLNPNLITSNSGFESGATGWQFNASLPGVATGGVQAGVSHDASAAYHVNISDLGLARYYINVRGPNNFSVTSGVKYSISFWAKASTFHAISLVLSPISGQVGLAEMGVPVDTTWKHYEFPLTPTASGTFYFRFDIGSATGDLWLDDLTIKQGLSSVYRRDFDHGSIFLNPDTSAKTVTLDHSFKRIAGVTATDVNTGATLCVTPADPTCQLTVPNADAIFLIDNDVTPPGQVTDLREQ